LSWECAFWDGGICNGKEGGKPLAGNRLEERGVEKGE